MKKWGPRAGRLPTLNHLLAFETAARLGSFRAAADALHVTQGAVAQQVRALEAELGRPLFHRLPRGLALTDCGDEYASRTRFALEILEAATREFTAGPDRHPPGQVLVSTTPSIASRWLIPRLERISAAVPAGSVVIDASDQLRPLHGDGRVDIAIRWGTPPFAEGTARFLLPGRAILVCAPALAGHADWQNADDLAGIPLISDTHRHWSRWFARHGRADMPVTGQSFSQTLHAIEAAERGLGVAIVPAPLVDSALRDGRLVRVLGEQYALDSDAGFYLLTADPPGSGVMAVADRLLAEAAAPSQA